MIQGRLQISKNDLTLFSFSRETGISLFSRHFSFSREQAFFSFFEQSFFHCGLVQSDLCSACAEVFG